MESKLNVPTRRLLTLLRVALGVGLLGYVLVKTGARQALVPLLAIPWLLLVLLIGVLFGAGVEALRLRVLFRAAGLRLSLSGAYRVVMIGAFFNFCIPGGTGGDIVKLYYLAAGNRMRGVEVATVMVMDRIIALVALLVLVLALSGWNAHVISGDRVLLSLVLTAAAVLGAVLLVMAAVGSRRVRASRAYAAMLDRLPLRKYIERAADAAHAFGDRKLVLLTAGGISLIGHIGAAVMFVVIGSVVVPSVGAGLTALLALMGMVANAIPVTPGGLGVGEAAFDQLFGVVGASGAAAILIAWRMALIPFAVAGAIAYMTGVGRRLAEDDGPVVDARVAGASPPGEMSPRTKSAAECRAAALSRYRRIDERSSAGHPDRAAL